jgi:hypothetical protein
MVQKALNYIKTRIESRWPSIPLFALIVFLRIQRFGHARTEITLFLILLIAAILWPVKSRFEKWDSSPVPSEER